MVDTERFCRWVSTLSAILVRASCFLLWRQVVSGFYTNTVLRRTQILEARFERLIERDADFHGPVTDPRQYGNAV